MRKVLTACLLILSVSSFAQVLQKEKIKLFVDCSTTYCDMNFIKTEITLVDFVLDNKAADVHVLITEQRNGGGGSQYQLIFFGQNKFSNLKDTLFFNTDPNNTEYEIRKLLVKYLQLGLVPFVTKTEAVKNISIQLKQKEDNNSTAKNQPTKDKWNYWVFRIGANGNFNGEKVYKGASYSGSFSANRITDQLKLSFSLNGNKNKTTYTIEDPTGVSPTLVIINNNHSFNFNHQLVKSINQHWSYGYDVDLSNSTFSNYKLQTIFSPAIEYNIFPYKESNNKLLSIRYNLDIIHNQYIDSTIYFKLAETLPGQGLNIVLSLNQKWGSSSVGLHFHNYFIDNLNYYNVGLNGSVNVRITGGLSFNAGFFGGFIRDQRSLSGKNASQQDILIRRRQLASNYNYFTFFGLNYRFGSKLNNFVNPRFESNNSFFFFN